MRIDGPGVLDVAVRENEDGIAISLVNLTNPMAMRGPIRDNIPLGSQRVTVRPPTGATQARGRLLVSDTDVDVDLRDGLANIDVPGVELLEVLKTDYLTDFEV